MLRGQRNEDCEQAMFLSLRRELVSLGGLRTNGMANLLVLEEILEHEMQGLKNAQRTPIIARSAPASRSSQSPNFSIRDGALHVPDLPDRISGQFESHAETESAIHDMMSLPRAFFHHLVDLWFKETQMWVPIVSAIDKNTPPILHLLFSYVRHLLMLT